MMGVGRCAAREGFVTLGPRTEASQAYWMMIA